MRTSGEIGAKMSEHMSYNCNKISGMPRMRSAAPSGALFTHFFLKVDAVQLRKIIEFRETFIKFKGFALSAGARENLQKGYKTMPQIL